MFVVGADNKVTFRPVKVGIAGEKYFEVLTGLKDGREDRRRDVPGDPRAQGRRARARGQEGRQEATGSQIVSDQYRERRRRSLAPRANTRSAPRPSARPSSRAPGAAPEQGLGHRHPRPQARVRHGRRDRARAARRRPRDPPQRVRRDHGTVGLGQVDADEPRSAASTRRTAGEYWLNGMLVSTMTRRRAGARAEQGDRVRLPDVQPAAARDGAA